MTRSKATSEELREVMQRFVLDVETVSDLLCVSPTTVRSWLSDGKKFSRPMNRAMFEYLKVLGSVLPGRQGM